ncbi:MAG TPA: xanthine dehydrogenase family protein subunit M [candidate division Zixibacteria bacterium]|nr:xanthine dehydrogenase family protein subunit M [candidate division Zixibacteria bacterium]
MRSFDYLEPGSVEEACGLLRQHRGEARVYAGGAHLTILMKQGLYRPRVLVNIKKIAGLREIRFDAESGLVIGALVTHREIETSAVVRRHFPVLAEAEREVANIRVRNVGTVGGNLASGEPLTDLSQIFIALEGRVEIAGPGGMRAIPVEELFVDFYQTSLQEDEILTKVVLPPPPARSGVCYVRFSSSSVVDKPSVGVAVRIRLQADRDACADARVVLGCVGPVPSRARGAEALLAGKEFSQELAERAGEAASRECSPVGDLRGSEEYKRAMVRTLVRRAAAKAWEQALGAA